MGEELLQLFPSPVMVFPYLRDYSKELEWIKNQKIRVADNPGINASRFFPSRPSEDSFILDNPELKKIRTFIETKLHQYVTKVMGSKDEFFITQSWVNRSKKGESNSEHVHQNSMISGVWYPVINKKLPPIQFRNPNRREMLANIDVYNNFNSEIFLLQLNAGELIIFPSNLSHSVPPNNSDEERISLSFNTWIKGNIGSIKNLTYIPI